MNYVWMGLVFLIIGRSIWHFMTHHDKRQNNYLYRAGMSFELFYTLIMLYCTVMIGFGLLYFIFSFYTEILVEIGQVPRHTVKETLFRSFYFSGVTMLTIGYGDIIPVGFGRLLAIIQALIGYILPTTFVLKLIHLNVEDSLIKRNHPK